MAAFQFGMIPQETVYAASGDDCVLAFTSDVHNMTDHQAEARLGSWIDEIEGMYGDGSIEAMSFGGDMADSSVTLDQFWQLTQRGMDVVDSKGVEGVYTTGNHEYDPGQWTATRNSTTARYTLNDWGKVGSNYRIYCLGSESSSNTYSTSQISTLTSKLAAVDNDKPIFIVSHYPLHYYKQGYQSRTITNASQVIDALNNAATGGNPQ